MQRDATSTCSMATSNCADPQQCPRVHMVFSSQAAYSNSTGTVVGEVCSSLSPAGTHCLVPQLSVSDHREDVFVCLRRDCFQVVVPLHPSRSDGLHRIQVVVHMQLRHADGAYRRDIKIKSLSLFQTKNNQISRDVKGLFLGHRFVWSRVIFKVPMLQLEDELLGKGRGNVRCEGTNGPGLIGRLSRPIRVRSSPYLGVKKSSLYKDGRCINQSKQEIRRKTLLSCRPWAKPHGWRSLRPSNPSHCHNPRREQYPWVL
jgi:hypothetical protein